MSASTKKWLGSALGVILAGLGVKFPQYAVVLFPFTSGLFGWLHLPQPTDAPKLPVSR